MLEAMAAGGRIETNIHAPDKGSIFELFEEGVRGGGGWGWREVEVDRRLQLIFLSPSTFLCGRGLNGIRFGVQQSASSVEKIGCTLVGVCCW